MTSPIRATAAALRNESADDMTMEMMPATTKPFSPTGSSVLTTNGRAWLEFRSGLIATATRPSIPVTAKNGMENKPAKRDPSATARGPFPISKRWT